MKLNLIKNNGLKNRLVKYNNKCKQKNNEHKKSPLADNNFTKTICTWKISIIASDSRRLSEGKFNLMITFQSEEEKIWHFQSDSCNHSRFKIAILLRSYIHINFRKKKLHEKSCSIFIMLPAHIYRLRNAYFFTSLFMHKNELQFFS